MHQASYVLIASTSALWILFMWSVVFAAVIGHSLRPIGVAAFRIGYHGLNRREAQREWNAAFDSIYLKMNIALAKPWAVTLLFFSLVLLGAGYGLGASGDIALLVTPQQTEALSFFDRYLDWGAATVGPAGMAGVLASISNRPRASILMSLGFTLSGIGIGIVTYLYF